MASVSVLNKGDSVFYADVSKDRRENVKTVSRAVVDLGLVPIAYSGAQLSVRESNIDAEIRADFYGASSLVLYFGPPDPDKNYEDNWVLPELVTVVSLGDRLLVYVSEDFPQAVLNHSGYTLDPRVVGRGDDLAGIVQDDLATLLSA